MQPSNSSTQRSPLDFDSLKTPRKNRWSQRKRTWTRCGFSLCAQHRVVKVFPKKKKTPLTGRVSTTKLMINLYGSCFMSGYISHIASMSNVVIVFWMYFSNIHSKPPTKMTGKKKLLEMFLHPSVCYAFPILTPQDVGAKWQGRKGLPNEVEEKLHDLSPCKCTNVGWKIPRRLKNPW